MEKRVFLIVLDSFGIGAEPDAALLAGALDWELAGALPPEFPQPARTLSIMLRQRTIASVFFIFLAPFISKQSQKL